MPVVKLTAAKDGGKIANYLQRDDRGDDRLRDKGRADARPLARPPIPGASFGNSTAIQLTPSI